MAARFALKVSGASASAPLLLPNLCIGTWAWGDASTWQGHSEAARHDLDGAWSAMQSNGLHFIDTAEVYGHGRSEEIIGELLHQKSTSPSEWKDGRQPIIATKFLPIPFPPTRLFMPSGMVRYCQQSLKRLGLDQMDLYQVHGPTHFLNSIDAIASGLAECVKLGLTKAVGVSNYSIEEMIKMDEALKKRGCELASNQVEFSLLRTLPEKSGLLKECKKRGIILLAYSPIGMGRLSGKYSAENPPPSGRKFSDYPMSQLEPLISTIKRVAEAHDVKPSAVALKWVIQKGAIPLGGSRTAAQVEENARAASDEWSISEEEMAELENHSMVGKTSFLWQHG